MQHIKIIVLFILCFAFFSYNLKAFDDLHNDEFHDNYNLEGSKAGDSTTNYQKSESTYKEKFKRDGSNNLTTEETSKNTDKKQDTIVNLDDYGKEKPLNNVIRFPYIGAAISNKVKGESYNDDGSKTSTKKTALSISGSYLYQLSNRFRLGTEIYSNLHSNKLTDEINIKESLSFLVRAEYSVYKNKSVDLYLTAGTGVSINQADMLYTATRVTTTDPEDGSSYTDVIYEGVIDGYEVPDEQAYFYCDYLEYNDLTTVSINDDNGTPDDTSDDISYTIFEGDGSGSCIYSVTDNSSGETTSLQSSVEETPVTGFSVPWFLGVGIDFNLTDSFNKLLHSDLNVKDDVKDNKELGLFINARYFSNGNSTFKKNIDGQHLQMDVSYDPYLDIGFGVYYKF